MARIFSFLLWCVVFCAALLLVDLIFVHVPMSAPGFKESQRFYRDFRQRLLTLRTPAASPPSIEAIIEQNTAVVPPQPAITRPASPEPAAPVPTPTAVTPPRPTRPAPAVAPPKAKAAPAPPSPVASATPVRAATAPVPAVAPRKSPVSVAGKSSGYVYADGEGELHFVDRLEQVPARYRREAQPLDN